MRKHIYYIALPLLMMAACSPGPDEESPYHRYADRKGLSVAEVDGFMLNDSVRVDVVLLQAADDAEWQRLAEEFDIRGDQGTVSWLADTENPAQRTLWEGQPVLRVIASPDKKAIGLYRIQNERQYDALIDYQIEKMKN